MSAGSILSLGFGTFSDINHIVTLGYTPGIGLAVVVPPVVVADVPTIIPPPRAPVDFVMNDGYLAGRFPRFRKVNKMIKPGPLPKQPEDAELREMMGIFALWKKAA